MNNFSVKPAGVEDMNSTIESLNSYMYSNKSLITIIENRLSPELLSTPNKNQIQCQDVFYKVYFDYLYYWWVVKNYSFVDADRIAYEWACFAYYGCLLGQGAYPI